MANKPPASDAPVHPLELRYQIESFVLVIAGYSFDLRVVQNTDELLDQLIARDESDEALLDERIPYWADLWPAAIALAEHILHDPSIGPGTQVLEIGCGLGLSGMAAAKKGAQVIMTDYLPEPLEMVAWHWELNQLGQPDCRLMDWRKPDPALAAEVVLASDVVYEARAFAPVQAALSTLVLPQGKALLSEPGRRSSRAFMDALPAAGFSLQSIPHPVEFRERKTPVSIYEIYPPS